VLSQGFPRLVTVPQAALQEAHDIKETPLGIHSRVVLNDEAAVVPDMLTLEVMIDKATSQAA
jgi:chemosensory pili system protein ChpC